MAPQAYAEPAGTPEPDLPALKHRAEQLITEFTAEMRRSRDTGGQYLDARRDLVIATQLKEIADTLARAACAEEIRAAVERRASTHSPPRRPHRSYRMLRVLQIAAGGTFISVAASAISAIAGT